MEVCYRKFDVVKLFELKSTLFPPMLMILRGDILHIHFVIKVVVSINSSTDMLGRLTSSSCGGLWPLANAFLAFGQCLWPRP